MKPYGSSPYGSRHVPGEGPTPCDLMFIGEGPGKEENARGRPFIGKSGQEFTRYLERACRFTGLTRDDVYVTNLVKYHIPDDGDPTEEDIRRDARELRKEVLLCNPSIICTLGRYSTRDYLGDVDMDAVHGVAHCRDNRIILPIFHPAAGLHNTEFQAKIWWDFERLAEILRGERTGWQSRWWEARDEHPKPDYADAGDRVGARIERKCAVDTEGSIAKPWGLSLCTTPGVALNFRHGDVIFQDKVVLWNALHDLGVLRAMGVEIADDQFDDAMMKAGLLCVEPQGLKHAALRHRGMKMRGYDELMAKPNNLLAARYFTEVQKWLNRHLLSASNGCSPTSAKKGRTRASAGRKSSKTRRKG